MDVKCVIFYLLLLFLFLGGFPDDSRFLPEGYRQQVRDTASGRREEAYVYFTYLKKYLKKTENDPSTIVMGRKLKRLKFSAI